jgi:hypothetical protein
VLLLAGVLLLLRRPTTWRLVLVCAAAGFSTLIRLPLAAYGVTTLAIALLVGRRRGMGVRPLLAGVAAFGVVTALYFAGNALRYGSPFNTGYSNVIAGSIVNRLNRWGLSFDRVPFREAALELFATLFRFEPVRSQIMMGIPPAVEPYAWGERWREYYSPTYDLYIFALWMAAHAVVGWRVVRRQLWRSDRDLRSEVPVIVGLWALPPAAVLFLFYARTDALVTRYLTDMYPALVGACLCVAMAIVDVFRARAPSLVGSAQLSLAMAAALYLSRGREWVAHLSTPLDEKSVRSTLAQIDASSSAAPNVADHFECHEPRGPKPVHTHLEEWHADCGFNSGMVFAMAHRPCVSFTFASMSGAWGEEETESLAGFRVTGDFDELRACGPPAVEGELRRATFCDPRRPAFLLDGTRLYCVASLDENLVPIEGLRIMSIDGAATCP